MASPISILQILLELVPKSSFYEKTKEALDRLGEPVWNAWIAHQNDVNMRASKEAAMVIKRYLGNVENRRVPVERYPDNYLDPCLGSINEIRKLALDSAGEFRALDWPFGEIFMAAILDHVRAIENKWAPHMNKGYTATCPLPLIAVENENGTVMRMSATWLQFAADLEEFRRALKLYHEGLKSML